MSSVAWLVLLGAIGVGFSVIAVRVDKFAGNKWFLLAACAIFLFMFGKMWAATGNSNDPFPLIALLFYTVILAFCWAFYFGNVIGSFVGKSTRSLLSIEDIRIPPPFSLVDAAISKRDYDKALALLLDLVVNYPAEAIVQRRLAELYLILDRPDDAITAYKHAERLDSDPNQKLLYVFSISETYADKKRDIQQALAVIEEFLASCPEVHGREFADERIARLKQRLQALGKT